MQLVTLTQDEFRELQHQIAEIREAVKSRKPQNVVYDNADVMQLLKVSQRTLATWREEQRISYSKIGSKIYYRQKDIEHFLDQGLVESVKPKSFTR